MPHYWIILQDGRVAYRQREPKARAFVAESVAHPAEQTTIHTLTAHVNGVAAHPVTLTCYCGYDRGPKLMSEIRNLLS